METLLHYLSYWDQALAIILVLGGLIFFHELGHYVMARLLKLGVVTFSLGFGPKLIQFTHNRTVYCLSLIPLGGYLATVGEYSEEVEELGFTQEEAVTNRPPLHKLLLAFSGPFANILLAFFIYWGIAWSAGSATVLPTIGMVMPQSVAAEAGLMSGDVILNIGDVLINEWNDVPDAIGKTNGETVALTYLRDNSEYTVDVTPKVSTRTNIFGEEEKAFMLGIQAAGVTSHSPLTFIQASKEGLYQTWYMVDVTVTGIKKLVTGSVPADSVGGPILIAQLVGSQAELGIIPLLLLAALISVNLGLLNLLPIPILDGGLIVFSLVEMITRKPVSEKVQERLMQVGGFLLIALMVFATFNDVMRIFR